AESICFSLIRLVASDHSISFAAPPVVALDSILKLILAKVSPTEVIRRSSRPDHTRNLLSDNSMTASVFPKDAKFSPSSDHSKVIAFTSHDNTHLLDRN